MNFAGAVVATSCFLLGVDPNPDSSKSSPQHRVPAIAIAIESWWGGKAEYEFDADGAIRFKLALKKPESRVSGQGKVSANEIERLIKALDEEGFFHITGKSIEGQIRDLGGRTSRRTDQRTYTVAIRYGKHDHRISYYDFYGDAKLFPKATDLQTLKKCIRRVEQFLNSTVQYSPLRDSAYRDDAAQQ